MHGSTLVGRITCSIRTSPTCRSVPLSFTTSAIYEVRQGGEYLTLNGLQERSVPIVKKQSSPRAARPVRTKALLLPLSTEKVRSLSLENHLALAAVRAARGDLDRLCCLLRVVYLAFYMRGETANGMDLELYRQAEAALNACIARIEHGEPCLLLDQEQTAVERVLVLHDQQLAAVPKFRYLDAWDQLQRFIVSKHRSPIPTQATE